MSRIGKEPISIPSDVQVSIEGRSVGVSGPKGSLDLDLPGEIGVRQEDDKILVERPNDDRKNKALHGLTRSLVNNMIIGVSEGFKKELEIVGVGYRAAEKGSEGWRRPSRCHRATIQKWCRGSEARLCKC